MMGKQLQIKFTAGIILFANILTLCNLVAFFATSWVKPSQYVWFAVHCKNEKKNEKKRMKKNKNKNVWYGIEK